MTDEKDRTQTIIEFIKDKPPYSRGDQAGFPAYRAQMFIDAKVAKEIKPKKKSSKPVIVEKPSVKDAYITK